MASFTGIDEEAAEAVLGASVVSGVINEAGHLILTRGNGSTIDAGDFSAIMTGLVAGAVNTAVAAAVPTAVAGKVVNRGDFSGSLTFTDAPGGLFTSANLVNALITLRATGNITIDTANLPSAPKPNTQFAVRIKQDGTGARTLTLAGFKKSMGFLTLTDTPNAIDVVVFYFDGTDWFAGFMGGDLQ
jgi:hypothetical protein